MRHKCFKDNHIELAEKHGGKYSLLQKGIKRGVIQGILRGSIPKANEAYLVANALGVTVEELVTGRKMGTERDSTIAEPAGALYSKPTEAQALPIHDLDFLEREALDKVQDLVDSLIEDKVKERRRKRSGLPASEPDTDDDPTDSIVPVYDPESQSQKRLDLADGFRKDFKAENRGIGPLIIPPEDADPDKVSSLAIIELYNKKISDDQWVVNLLADFDLPENAADIKGYRVWKKGDTNRWVPIAPRGVRYLDERTFEVCVRAKKGNPYALKIQTVYDDRVSDGTKSNTITVPCKAAIINKTGETAGRHTN